MKVVASCTIQGDTFVIAPPGQLFAEVGLSDGLNEDTDAGLLSSALVEISCGFASTNFLSPLHTGDKVEFNTVNFVESRQSQLCGFGPVHTGNRVNCVALAPYTLATKSTVSATKSTATSCRIHLVADLLPKPATKLNISATKLNVYGNSWLCCRFWQQSTFNIVDRVEFNFVTSVYRALDSTKRFIEVSGSVAAVFSDLVSLWRDADNVTHCRILSSDKAD